MAAAGSPLPACLLGLLLLGLRGGKRGRGEHMAVSTSALPLQRARGG